MDYAHPEYLAYRPWLIAFGALWLALNLQQAWALRKAVSGPMGKRFGPAFSPWRAGLKALLWSAAGYFLLLALATPLGAPIKVETQSSGADIILAVDVSSSMYAQDVAPNRILAVKAALGSFINRLQGDRVGVIAFAGEAVIACPLTTDYDTAQLFLDKLETDSVPQDGTGFAQAIKLCLDGFAPDSKRGRMIIMATDGEDTLDEDASSEAKRAGSLGIPIFTLGVGTKGGAYIPGRPDVFGRVSPKMYHGQPIRVSVNPDTLRKISSLSGGEYFDGASQAGMNRAYERIRELKQGAAKSQDRYVRDPLYQEPLLTAIVLLLIELLLSNRSGGSWLAFKRARKFISSRWLGRAALFGLALLPFSLRALSLDPGRGEYDQGNELYRQGQYDKAQDQYKQSLQGNADREQSHYNLGNAQFMQEDYQGAIGSYQDALKLDPKDADAQYNLDLAQKKLEEKQQQKKDGKKDGKDKKPGDKKGQGSGQGPSAQSSGGSSGSGQASGGNKSGQGKSGGDPKNNLKDDQIQAMMNMLKGDQKRYGQAFQPLKKYQKPQDQDQDPVQQMFEQMTGQKLNPQAAKPGPERKDW